MGWFRKTLMNAEELAQVKLEIAQLRAAIDKHDSATAGTSDASSNDGAAEASAPAPALSDLVSRIDALDLDAAGRGDGEIAGRLDAMAAQLSSLDARVTSVSTELANQISELGHDIDALHQRANNEPVADEVIDGVRNAQERLAAEQARYQIAFREDLARLAEQLKRPRT